MPDDSDMPTISVGELFDKMGDILTLEALQSIWNATGGNRDLVTRELKARFAPHAEALEAQGLVGDYLAYMLPYTLGPHLEAERRLRLPLN